MNKIESVPVSHDIREIQWRGESAKSLLPRIEALLPRIHVTPPFDISFVDVLGIPIYIAVRSNDIHSTPFDDLMERGQLDFFYTHHGKGVTHEQSRVSCVMETIERHCASYHQLETQPTAASYDQLGQDALNPASFFLAPGVEFTPDKPVTVTYHDPCHASRGQNLICEPREIIKKLPGVEYVELPEADWCCGGAGSYALSHYELSRKVLDRKMNNVKQTGADLLVTSCPACMIQLSYGVRKHGLKTQVCHISELISQNQTKPK